MAVIQFTPADAMQTITVEAGIYPCDIAKIEGPKTSSSGKSVNYFAEIRIIDGKYKGKERTIMFNSESNDVFAPGGMLMLPQATLLQIDAAINNKKVEAVDYALDTDTLVGKPFDAQWTVVTVEGRLYNHIVAFHPKGYAASAPSW